MQEQRVTTESRKFFEPAMVSTARVSRLGLGVFGVLWMLYGAISFYSFVLQGYLAGVSGISIIGKQFVLGHLLALLLFVAGCGGLWHALNSPKLITLLADTEGEMRKVAWPTRQDLIRSTIIVLCFIAVFSGFQFLVDAMFLYVMNILL